MDATQLDTRVARAVEQVLAPIKRWGESRMFGTPAEKSFWRDMLDAAPSEMTKLLHEAGFTLVQMGGRFPIRLWEEKAEYEFRTEFRVQMQSPSLVLWCSQTIGEPLASDPDFRLEHLPRVLAKSLLSRMEQTLSEDIAKAIEARSGETSGSTEGESAVRQDLPKE